MAKYKAAIIVDKTMAEKILSKKDYDFLRSFADVNPVEELPAQMTLEYIASVLPDADVCLTGWGTPNLTDEIIASAKKLRLIAHSAGTIKFLIPPGFWNTGIRAASNAPIIADDVAQTCLTYILCTIKGLWQYTETTRAGNWGDGVKSVFNDYRLDGKKVGIISASHVGRILIQYLKPFKCEIYLYDPYISAFDVAELGVKQIGLDELMKESDKNLERYYLNLIKETA
jgi:phosphoglycerate dehydrogenase-like enzyme